MTFSELEVARFWGIIPSVFEACSDQDKLKMIAYMETHGEMRAVEDFQLQKKLEEQKRKNKAKTR
jgi:hypothetical protein